MEIDYHQLAVKAISDGLEEEDQKLLEAWLSSSPVHRTYYEELKAAWELSGKEDLQSTPFEVNMAWESFKKQLSPETQEIVPVKDIAFFRQTWFYQVAASLLLVAGLSYLMLLQVWKGQEETLQYATAETADVFYLPDSSTVWLNKHSTLSYMKKGRERTVTLKGQAFFDVKRDVLHPFIIHAAGTETRVLGTSFELNAYRQDTVELTVVSGKVSFSAGEASIIVLPQEKGVFRRTSHQLSLQAKDTSGQVDQASWIGANTYDRSAAFAAEKANPPRYITHTYTWRSNLLNQSVVEGTLVSSAKLYSYERVHLKATCISVKHKTIIHSFTVMGQLAPGGRISYKKRLPDWFKDTRNIKITLEK